VTFRISQEIHLRAIDAAFVLKRRLKSARKLLKQFGALLVSDSQGAFQDQEFGGVRWPERYPQQADPFLNIAGAVQDFTEGRKEPRSDRFQRRPALVTNDAALSRSISSAVVGDDAVQVGSVVPYADAHQLGLTTSQPVTEDTKDRIAEWIYGESTKKTFVPDYVSDAEVSKFARAKGMRAEKGGKRNRKGEATFKVPNPYRTKLEFLLQPDVHELTTQVHARPFIGVTEHRAQDFAKLIAAHMAGETN
jgi:phage gpG-like protein